MDLSIKNLNTNDTGNGNPPPTKPPQPSTVPVEKVQKDAVKGSEK